MPAHRFRTAGDVAATSGYDGRAHDGGGNDYRYGTHDERTEDHSAQASAIDHAVHRAPQHCGPLALCITGQDLWHRLRRQESFTLDVIRVEWQHSACGPPTLTRSRAEPKPRPRTHHCRTLIGSEGGPDLEVVTTAVCDGKLTEPLLTLAACENRRFVDVEGDRVGRR